MVISGGVEADEEKEDDQSHVTLSTNYPIGSMIYHRPQFLMSRSSIAPATTKPRHSEQELKNMNCSEEKAEVAAAGVQTEDDSAVKRGEQQSDTVTAVVGTSSNVLENGEKVDTVKAVESTTDILEPNSVLKSENDVAKKLVDVMKEENHTETVIAIETTKVLEAESSQITENVVRNIPTDDAVTKGEQSGRYLHSTAIYSFSSRI